MMNNSLNLIDKKNHLKKEMRSIVAKCSEEIRTLNEQEQEQYNHLLEEVREINKTLEDKQVKQNRTMEKKEVRYNLLDALNRVANNLPLDQIQQEVNKRGIDALRGAGVSPNGQIILPSPEMRNSISVVSDGEHVVATHILNLREEISERSILGKLGITTLDNLQGDIQLPNMSSVVDLCSWENETDAVGDSKVNFTSKKLQPRRLSVSIPVSKMFLLQNSVSAEQTLKNAIIRGLLERIEKDIFSTNDDDGGKRPEGLFKTVDTTLTDFASITEFEASIDKYNNIKYALNPKTKAKLRTMAKSKQGVEMVYTQNEVDGLEALVSGYLPQNHLVLGDFTSIVLGLWSGVELVVDPYTRAKNGEVILTASIYTNWLVQDENAIKVAKFA